MPVARELIAETQAFADAVDRLNFSEPVATVYNPLQYAWALHRAYLERYAATTKRVIFLGMNPGPFGMVQTGIPFGEVAAVKNWMQLGGEVKRPCPEHPKRPIEGLDCQRSEVSGRRLWGLFADRFGTPEAFFKSHFVVNYCPLAFLEASGRNRTPDKLPAAELNPLLAACDAFLAKVVDILQPEWVVGVGGFAEQRATLVLGDRKVRITRILHPSPASPAANRDWSGQATRAMEKIGLWDLS